MKKDKLHNIKSTGFKTPDNYFENFEDTLLERLSKNEYIGGVNSTGFKTPDNYFENFNDNLIERIKKTNKKPVVKFLNRNHLFYISGIAASLLLVFTIFYTNKNVNEISIEMVETYLENQDLDSYELAQLLSDADLLEEDFTITKPNYTEEYLESYLLDNADIETILE